MTCRHCSALLPLPSRNGKPRIFCCEVCQQRWHRQHRRKGDTRVEEYQLGELALCVPRIRQAVMEALR